ncbi:cytochrome b [Pseudomonas sp. NA-150]|uniref:cytochrome b n=1 Tax=Pseudomonas sp. NA-150 TaxID=3367525 RepID=UPI0037C764DA
MRQNKYSSAQIALHWLSAFVILWSLCAGTYVTLFDVPPGVKLTLTALNISLTTLFIPFFLMRAVLRIDYLRKHSPGPGELLAAFVHNLIYLVTGLVLVTGVLMMDRPIVVFDWLTLPQLLTRPDLLQGFHTAHRNSTELLGLLVGLHLLAVVKHELSGNRILQHMSFQTLPWAAPLGMHKVNPTTRSSRTSMRSPKHILDAQRDDAQGASRRSQQASRAGR